MTPSVLAQQLEQGVKDFLRTTFPISTPHFHGMVERLLEAEGGIFKGPYISLDLPFRSGEGEGEHFPNVPLGFRPYLHQERAFRRLGGEQPRSTLVATGTGSGKTESFLVPILDHCHRHRGEPGIKAILIYPMNALANDQAGRLAKMIWRTPGLKGEVRAGLYVGQKDDAPRAMMTENGIITDKNTLRMAPPDILLTNYKMLDYLLVRPEDFPLWQQNGPETLRFLVVDELHTFDGAQGTDLACLIRRLKARLGTPERHLCCVGTSATLGGEDARQDLIEYATKIFGEPFDDDAVITETRQTEAEFLEGAFVRALSPVQPEQAAALSPEAYADREGYLRAQVKLWFGPELQVGDWQDSAWRVELGELLKSHPLFRNLLIVLDGEIKSLDEVQRALSRATPELRDTDPEYQRNLLDSLLALVSEARVWAAEREKDRARREEAGRPRPTRPFLDMRVQLWLRELRRMVASVVGEPNLAFFDDLTEDQRRNHLPVVHCRDCGSTGWGAMLRPQDTVLQRDLEAFYQGFFAESPNVTFLFPGEPESTEGPAGRWLYLDSGLRLHASRPDDDEALRVFVPDNTRQRGNRLVGHHDCPYCGSREGLTILGSRAASLTSVLITQLYGSSFNDDKKLIAFSDSVQDASHRAGFFGARTYRFSMRMAIQQFVQAVGEGLTLEEMPAAFRDYWLERMDRETYVATFIGPDMMWLRDYEHLVDHGRLPQDSTLPELVDKRVAWEIYSEYSFRARIGRTLEKSGGSIVYPDSGRLDGAVDALLPVLQNEIGGMRELGPDRLRMFLVGLLTHLRTQGAVFQEILATYIRDGGQTYWFNRHLFLPGFGPRTRAPVFLTSKYHPRFEALFGKTMTWYEEWAEKCFDPITPLVSGSLQTLYQFVLKGLLDHEVLVEESSTGNPVWGMPADALRVTCDVLQFRCERCGHSMSGAGPERRAWEGAPCLRSRCTGHYTEADDALDYYGKLYSTGNLKRIVAREHTGLLERTEREILEHAFMHGEEPWTPNLLSCTPTLEMGIDIGDLSTVVLCSIPPTQANYIQRIGRAGRRDGNALNLAVANGRPHDLYFYADPREMISGQVDTPGVYLSAAAVLERQFTGYCLDRWVETGLPAGAIPPQLRPVLDQLQSGERTIFPFNFLDFVAERNDELVEGFLALFGAELENGAREHIQEFAGGDEAGEGSIAYKIVDGLHQVRKDREALKKTVQRLNRQIKAMRDQEVRDKNYDEQLGELKSERSALQRIITEKINRRHTLNFLTDEGLIPNYAFPEAGVTLRSVIYRKRGEAKEDGYESRIYEYERPAVSAISELAPHNRFYAGGRNVRIDQVDLNATKIERWRLCDNCAYSELQVEGETPLTCPRCGSVQWGDAGQEHWMLRLRQVFATASDRTSRTGDDHDDRRPVFFNKQLLVDYEETHVTSAFLLEDDALPFGFEFLSKVSFKEVNFGEKELAGPEIRIAGLKMPRQGFKVCRHCGKVQQPGRRTEHAFGCPVRDSDDEGDFIDCLYLYRQFASEAIRILLPETTFAGSDRTLHSFIAALQLGLRRMFRGSIDHLQVTTYEEPIPDTPHRKRSLVLYDTVPGGTGYLKELMRSPEPLLAVFEEALEALRSCSCNEDQDADGCYRCLFAYRNSYDMAETSRDRATELLSDVLRRRDRLKRVESLRKISGHVILESELEARFIVALGQAEGAMVKRRIVHGKPGFFLKLDERAYHIVPQVELGGSEGVGISSRADFVIYPARSGEAVKPIAIFTDGWSFHRDRIGKDLAQRMAIAQSGRYQVWSLTWLDIENALTGSTDHYVDLLAPSCPLPGSARHHALVQGLDGQHGVGRLRDLPKKSSFQWLVQYLRDPNESVWRAYAALQVLMHIDGKIKDPADQQKWKNALREALPDPLADGILDVDPDVFGGYDPMAYPVRAFMAAPSDAVSQLDANRLCLAYVLDDEEDKAGQDGYLGVWNGFLRLHNLYQFIPSALLVSTRGITSGAYDSLDLKPNASGIATAEPVGEQAGWEEARELTDPEVHPLLDALAREGWDVPEVGYEPTGENGVVLGMAELAWPKRKLALFYEQDLEFGSAFQAQGWTVGSLEDAIRSPESFIAQFARA